MCWYYNGANNLDPETLKEKWFPRERFPSLGAAKAAANNATISGVPPATPQTDTLAAVIRADGR